MQICKYCSSEFKSLSSLNQHIKTAKYCIKLQENVDSNQSKFVCNFCNKSFTQQNTLHYHLDHCVEKLIFDKTKSLKEEYELKVNELSASHEKEVLVLKNEIKIKDMLNKELKSQIKELNQSRDKIIYKQSMQLASTNNQNTQINNITYINKQTNHIAGSIDLSQERFDKIVEESFTYQLFEKGSVAGRQLLVSFLTDELGILRIEVCDDSRNKLKIIDRNTGQTKYIDHFTLFNKFIKSSTLTKCYSEYIKQYTNTKEFANDSVFYTQRISFYRDEKKFKKQVYNYFKSHVKEFGQLLTLDELNNISQNSLSFNENTEEYEEKIDNSIFDE